MTKNNEKKSLIKRLTSKNIILTIQFLTSVVFVGFSYILNIIPMRYFVAMIAILILLFGMIAIWMQSGIRKKKKSRSGISLALSKMLSVIISITLLMGTSYIIRGNSFLDMISSAFQQTRNISVYVLNDSPIEEVEDIENATVGISYKEDTTYIRRGLSELESALDSNVELVESDGYAVLASSLYNLEVDCIIADEAYLTLLQANHEHFEAETRRVVTYTIVEEIRSVTTDTNVTRNPFTIYLAGIDTYGDVSTVARTDVNLVAVVNPLEKQILLVSIPRDMEVTLATYNHMDKLSHSAIYGINETIQTLNNFLDIDLNFYAKTNFSGIIDIIDQLGGVTIDSPHEDFVTMHGNYTITKGINEMDGDKALCFVRERYALPNGDLDRGRNQQLLLKAMLEKAMSSRIITNYNSILSAIEGSFETDMSSDSIRSLINMQLNDMSEWEIFDTQVIGQFSRSAETYSMYGTSIDTIIPDTRVVNQIVRVIDKMELGQRISDADLQEIEY